MERTVQQAEITRLLHALSQGDKTVEDKLFPMVYGELRRVAKRYMAKERPDHTLQATALVNEAYLRLTGQPIEWTDRAHFFAIAATMMRRILVDYARNRVSEKRGSGVVKAVLTDALTMASQESCENLLAVHEALARLEKVDPRAAQVVEYKFFTGLDVNEIAKLLDVSTKTVQRDWEYASTWLYDVLATVEKAESQP